MAGLIESLDGLRPERLRQADEGQVDGVAQNRVAASGWNLESARGKGAGGFLLPSGFFRAQARERRQAQITASPPAFERFFPFDLAVVVEGALEQE